MRFFGIKCGLIELARFVIDESGQLQHRARISHLAFAIVIHPTALDQFVVHTHMIRASVFSFGVNKHFDFKACDLFHHHFKKAFCLGFYFNKISTGARDNAGIFAVCVNENAFNER